MFFGLDLGSKLTGYAVLERDGTRIDSGTWEIEPAKGTDSEFRYVDLRRRLIELIAEHRSPEGVADYLGYENAKGQRGWAQMHFDRLVSTVTTVCIEASPRVHYAGVIVKDAKKVLTGKHGASKAQMVAAATARWPVGRRKMGEDEADALAVAECVRLRVCGVEGA